MFKYRSQRIKHSFLVHTLPLRSEIRQIVIVLHYFTLERILPIKSESLQMAMKLRSLCDLFLFVAKYEGSLFHFYGVLSLIQLLRRHPLQIRISPGQVNQERIPRRRRIWILLRINQLVQSVPRPCMEFMSEISVVRLGKAVFKFNEVLELAEVSFLRCF